MRNALLLLAFAGVLLLARAGHAQDGERGDAIGAFESEEGRASGGGLVEAVGGGSEDVFYDVIETSDGGVVAVGYTSSFGAGGRDVLLVKFDTCGEFVWKKTLGGSDDEEGRSVIEVPGGDLVVTGLTGSFGGPGDHLLLSRFTASGVEVWTTVLTDPSGDYELHGYDVIKDSSDDLVVTGTVWNNTLGYSVLMAKCASDGSLVTVSGFRRPITPLYDYWGESLVEACDGDYIVVGGLLAPGDDRRVLLARIKPGLLVAEWGRWIQEGEDDAVGHSITRANDGALVLTGDTGGHLFLSKRDCTGSALPYWQKKLPAGSVGHSVIQTSGLHDLVVAGELGTHFLVGSWATNGSARWIRGWAEGVAYGVAEDITHRLWIAGTTSLWGAGGADGLVAKLDPDGHTCLLQTHIPTTPVDWNPAEDDHALTWHALPVEEWQWSVDSADASQLQQYVECDDECEGCCLGPEGDCENLPAQDCTDQGGNPQGPGTDCAIATTFLCCSGGTSVPSYMLCCDDIGGTLLLGEWPQPEEACCLPDGTCVMADPACCEYELQGLPQGAGTDCDPNPCPPPPACLGTWLGAPLNTAEETYCAQAGLTLCGPESGPQFGVTDVPDDVIWYNYHDYRHPFCASHWDVPSSVNAQVADDFRFLDDVVVTGVRWVGAGYRNSAYGLYLPTAFNVLFYADDGSGTRPTGGPGDPSGTALASYTIPIESISITDLAPLPMRYYIFEYDADLPFPFFGTPGTKYWIAIQAVSESQSQWGIAGCEQGQLAVPRQGFPQLGVDYWEGYLTDDRAFQLRGTYVNPHVCGDGEIGGPEECDGTNDAACPGECIPPGSPYDCTCPCRIDCPPGAIPGETEPCDDSTQVNAGCNAEPPNAASAEDTLQCGVTVCGTSWLTDAAVDYDQYAVVLPTDQIMRVTFEAEFPTFCGFMIYNEGSEGSGECNDLSGYWQPHATPKCTVRTFSNVQGTASDECMQAGTYFLQIAVNWGQLDYFPCSSPFGENDYYITLDCEPCSVLRCPENSLFEQVVQGEDSDYWFATASDEALDLTWYEDFDDVYGDVCDIHFWGLMYDKDAGVDCLEDPMTFEVRFFQPDGVTQIGVTYTLAISPEDTYHAYDPDPYTLGDEMTLWEFSADLDPCVPLWDDDIPPNEDSFSSGWVSIQALGDDDCLFYWAAADACDSGSRLWDDDEGAFCDNPVDLSLCLTGEEGFPVLGACCYEPMGDCFPGEMISCTGAGYRFEPYTDCEALDPPCGVVEGACCDPETGFCTYQTMDECFLAGGIFTAHGTCDPNTCPQPDPCDGPTVIYEQTSYDDDPDAMPFSYRNYGEVGIITAADVTFESPTEITDFHWWATDKDCFNWTGFADVLVYPDAGGVPQVVPAHTSYNVPSYRAYYNGETVCDGDLEVLIYTIILEEETDYPPFTLPAGTWWIGMRPVGLLYDWSAMMVTSSAIGQPYRQKWDDESAWIPEDAGDPDIAFCLTYSGRYCPGSIISASPPDGTLDARKPHPGTSRLPCYGFGMPDDPGTAGRDESTFYPIVIDLGDGNDGADPDCWKLCETPDMSGTDCGSNSIANVVDNGDGTYEIQLAHGVAAGCLGEDPVPAITTIQYDGGDYVEYIHHPANADGSLKADANDIIVVVNCLNSGTCPDYRADTDSSSVQGANDIIEEVDMLNGANAYCPWFGTDKPENNGDCPL